MNNSAEREIATIEREPAQLPTARQEVSIMSLISLAVEKDASIEKLQQLMDLQERWESNQARKAFDAAISQARAEIKPIVKKAEVDFTTQKGRTHYKHETLDAIAEQIDPVLSRHGLSYRFRSQQDSGLLTVTCVVAHRDGHYEETALAGPPDMSGSKNAYQAVGSAATYLQRYTLKLALGLSAAKDDDAQEATPEPPERPAARTQELPDYPKDRLDKNLPEWKASIGAGERKPEDIIKFLASRFTLSDQQKKEIRDCAAKEGEIV